MPLLLVHLAATLFMGGLIWFVQVVHYPLFALAGAGGGASPAYQAAHMQRTGLVVGPPMLVEAATALLLLAAPPEGIPRSWLWAGLFALALIWAVTALASVPAHEALARGFDADVHRALVRSNWARTLLWTARGALALALVARVARGGAA